MKYWGPVLTFSLVLLAGANSAKADWVECAGEGGLCDLDGVGIVRYGVDDRWSFQVGTDAYPCSFQQFGDPAPGVAKACWRWEQPDETAQNAAMQALQVQLQQAQQRISQLEEQQQYLADLEAEVAELRRELRQVRRGRRDRRGDRDEFGPLRDSDR